MPYKDKALKSQRQRERRKGEAPATNEAPNPPELEAPIAIVKAITDPKIRPRIEKISQELNSRGLGKDVRYGIDGPTFDVVAKLLEITR